MENSLFKQHLIRKLIVSGAFAVLTVGAIVGITLTNAKVIAPNEGFITATLCTIETGGVKNNSGDKLAVEIEQEGIVLSKNDNNVLPLSKDVTNVNVFGYDVVEWVISNSGSGSADGNKSGYKAYGILDTLDERGITYNQDIINYYTKWATPRDRGVKSYSSSYDTIYRLTNPSLSNNADYAALYEAAKGQTDTAIVCIGRYGGEHLDPPHEQVNNYKAKSTKNVDRGYLEITLEEEELLKAVGQDYEKVIVIINSTNVMQMDFMRDIPGLDACLLVGPTGSFGYKAIGQVLWGEINPSGRTADTWPMNHRYNVTYYTSGFWSNKGNSSNAAVGSYYTGVPSGANLANNNTNAGHGHAIFADYYEGIYVGYKWFETADAEGFWNKDPYNGYENVVAYPFGYGLSYTTFSWKLKYAQNSGGSFKPNQELEFIVEVTNTGKVAGRDVVELYLTAPYYKGEIEKSSVKLVGFQKTGMLMPGETRDVTIKVNTNDFMSFDCYDANNNGHAGYELDKGDYVIKAMTDAHNLRAGSNNNTVKYRLSDTINVDEDDKTGNKVEPLFTGENAIDGVSIDGKSIGEPIEYLTRAEFAPLMTAYNPTRAWNKGLVTCDDSSKPTAYSTKMANAWDNATTDVFGNAVRTDEPTFGADNGLKVLDSKNQLTELGMKLAEDYNAPEWDALLDQLSWKEGTTIPAGQSYSRPGFKSLGLKKGTTSDYADAEGASMVGASVNGKNLTAYPDPCLQAQTWNEDMLYLFGLSEAKDMALGGKDYLYGPASNIHRNPYGGRHAEYHSEDGFLAGRCLANVTRGLSDGGKNGFIKHFVANDTEYHRVGLFTWMTEQALREIYLRPFEESIKRGEGCAVMSSFNRIGAIWTGGSQALCQGVLRNEWGFNGMMITDYTENGTLQDANQMFRAGGNYILASSNFSDPGQSKATPRFKWRVRESAKQVVYGSIRPLYTNYLANTDPERKQTIVSSSKAPYVWWKPALACAEALVIVGCAFGIVAALIPANKEFREELFARLGKKKKDAE